MEHVLPRRTVVAAMGVAIAGAGCLGGGGGDGGPAESGTVTHPDDENLTVDVESGETLRVEVTNEEGVATVVDVLDPEYDELTSQEVESELSFTHEAELGGTYRVQIAPFGEASYEISVE